ncbi:hypothetical protein CHARACLAT_004086 [Characodon lateralis]|uniref:Uncharacterized protein n=1 Tax=Characodon lateralis TaxID=208331 RepID=A0ABU7D3Y5_9TELE|nr:hypothetical protein [Characodon lateralis]
MVFKSFNVEPQAVSLSRVWDLDLENLQSPKKRILQNPLKMSLLLVHFFSTALFPSTQLSINMLGDLPKADSSVILPVSPSLWKGVSELLLESCQASSLLHHHVIIIILLFLKVIFIGLMQRLLI